MEIHRSDLRDLLVLWGDRDFSATVDPLPAAERQELKSTFSEKQLRRAHFSSTARLIYGANQI
jgi:hypothetical protein